MNNIRKNIEDLRKQIPAGVKIVAVSKTKTVEEIRRAWDCGLRIFGENRVQELVSKNETTCFGIDWHMIGHLQTNKVKYISSFISLIHSVDSLKLLIEINKEAEKNNRIIPCLLQFHIAAEETKFGFGIDEIYKISESGGFGNLSNVCITGVMGMASFTDDKKIIEREFRGLFNIFSELKKNIFPRNTCFREVSMGMSNDYLIAIGQGSTMIRIGSNIFGGR